MVGLQDLDVPRLVYCAWLATNGFVRAVVIVDVHSLLDTASGVGTGHSRMQMDTLYVSVRHRRSMKMLARMRRSRTPLPSIVMRIR